MFNSCYISFRLSILVVVGWLQNPLFFADVVLAKVALTPMLIDF